MNSSLRPDEVRVLDVLLPLSPHAQILRRQIEQSAITRDWTGCGFFTTFKLPSNVEPTPTKGSFDLHAWGRIGGADCGFFLMVSDGIVDYLECFTIDENNLPQDAVIDTIEPATTDK